MGAQIDGVVWATYIQVVALTRRCCRRFDPHLSNLFSFSFFFLCSFSPLSSPDYSPQVTGLFLNQAFFFPEYALFWHSLPDYAYHTATVIGPFNTFQEFPLQHNKGIFLISTQFEGFRVYSPSYPAEELMQPTVLTPPLRIEPVAVPELPQHLSCCPNIQLQRQSVVASRTSEPGSPTHAH